MLAPDRYLGQDIPTLTERYIEVCCQLSSWYAQHHDSVIAERKARDTTFWSSPETTVAAKNREADTAALDFWIAVEDTKMQIAQYQEERNMLQMLIWGSHA